MLDSDVGVLGYRNCRRSFEHRFFWLGAKNPLDYTFDRKDRLLRCLLYIQNELQESKGESPFGFEFISNQFFQQLRKNPTFTSAIH